MEPFEPRDVGRAGTDLSGGSALDRLRHPAIEPPPRASRSVFAWVLAAALLAFALGLIANPWFERSVRSHLPGFAPTLTPTVADLAALDERVTALETRPARTATVGAADPASGERLARVEGGLATLAAGGPAATVRTDRLAADVARLSGRIDASSATTAATLANASASAERAQAMLVVAEARRQLSAGARLGPLEPALRRAFAARGPGPVEAVAALGANPVTLAALQLGLGTLKGGTAPATTAGRDWWQALRDSVSGMVVAPATEVPTGTDAAARLDRATRALAAGNVAAAMAEVAALPTAPRARAQAWLAAAGRYQAGWRGLAVLEATLLDPLPATGA